MHLLLLYLLTGLFAFALIADPPPTNTSTSVQKRYRHVARARTRQTVLQNNYTTLFQFLKDGGTDGAGGPGLRHAGREAREDGVRREAMLVAAGGRRDGRTRASARPKSTVDARVWLHDP